MINSSDFNTTFAGQLISETETLTTGLISIESSAANTYFTGQGNKYNLLTILNDKEAYLYDIIVILKFYAIIHRLFWYHFNITLKNDEIEFKKFIIKAKLKFTSDVNINCRIENNEIILNNLFNLESLKLNDDNVDYNFIYNINPEIIGNYDKKFEIKYVPFYHNFNKDTKKFTKFKLFNNFITTDYNNILKINIEHKTDNDNFKIDKYNKINKILVENAIFTSTKINEYYVLITANTYQEQRRKLYLYVFNTILNINNTTVEIFLTDIIKKMYNYNKILYNALIQYGYGSRMFDDITNFNNNLKYIIKYYNDILNNNIGDKKFITYKDKLDFKDFNNNIQTFQDISIKYKNEWNIYNKGLYYYRILLFISIILFISIVIISNININDNTIILIFIIKIILILSLILFIYKKPKKEHFSTNDDYSLYAQTIIKYDLFVSSNKLDLKLDSDEYRNDSEYILNLNKNLHLKFDDTIINDYNEKLEYYKVKSIDLYNSITTLKKTNVINYYIILIIYVSFIFLIIGLICLMLYPYNLYSIIISLSIIFIITLIILFIKLHKNTNMDNDKNYWSNFNPSDNLKYNDDGLT
jgi:hypothetical protein